jgi:hypothetical protein
MSLIVDERPSVMERLTEAMVSKNLMLTPDRRRDLDYLIALGAVMQRRPAGLTGLLRLALGDEAALRGALAFAMGITRKLALKRGWKAKQHDLVFIARKAVEFQCSPACPTCRGVKFKVIKNTPALSGKTCDRCHGTGRRPYPIRQGREIAEVVCSIEALLQGIEISLRAKLG